jgi:chemotaxis protein histidine kinase CheA
MANTSATLLSWITAEVDQALVQVRDRIARFLQNGDAAALQPCAGHLHQVAGALRMVGLAGATRFCEAIERALAAPASAPPGRAALETIDRAIQALKEFVHGLGRGQANAPLRLFPLYRELAQLSGDPEPSERDLFFPDTTPRAPPHPQPKSLSPEEMPAYQQAQRAQFQKGLLAWLRGQSAGIDQMRHAVDGFHRIAEQLPEPQAIWWVAAGVLEALDGATDPEWLGLARALGHRIDRQMREGLETVNESLLCDSLYAIARSRANSPLIEEIRQRYALDSLLPEAPGGPRADLRGQTGAFQLRAELVKDVVASLQQVERVLEAFARDPARRDTLPGLQPQLRQINSALLMLRFEQAARVLALCENMIAQCAAPDRDGADGEIDWIAEGLSSIGMFLAPCLQAREPAPHAIELFFRRYDKAHTPLVERGLDTTVVLSAAAIKKSAARSPGSTQPIAAAIDRSQPMTVPPKPAPPRPAADPEMLGVFLEDAAEVLERLGPEIASLRARPQDLDLLAGIRRGFHTLKGGSRMAGLMDLGEVAWEVEQVLNRWLQKEWPASADLRSLIEQARAAFSGWIGQLREGHLRDEIDARGIVAAAARLRALETAPAAEPHEAGGQPRDSSQAFAGLGEAIARLREQLQEVEHLADGMKQARLQELLRTMQRNLEEAEAIRRSLHEGAGDAGAAQAPPAAATRSRA